MKISRLFFGFLLAASTDLSVGVSAPDAQFSSPSRKDSSSVSDDKGRSEAPDPPVLDSGRRGNLEDTIAIVSVTEQKPDTKGSRKVTVRVRYALVHYPKGVVSLGFNLKSATKFTQITTQPVLAGLEEIDLSATIVPVVWPKDQPFKLCVSLSAEPHPNQWSMLAALAQPMKPAATPLNTSSEKTNSEAKKP